MTPEDFAERMKAIIEMENAEEAHSEADKLMCDALRSLGYGEGVDAFEKADFWYA
jgi:hypothetical protein